MNAWSCLLGIVAAAAGVACGSDDDKGTPYSAQGTAQRPAAGESNVESWLQSGVYKSWHCESAVHESRSPSPHGYNRICSNDAISTNATGTGDWPEGAGAVKELYDSATSTTPSGYAVYLKTSADSAGGANWYWYERLPGGRIAADGLGNAGNAKSTCVGCHAAAGADAAHTPTPGGRDQVYTPVP